MCHHEEKDCPVCGTRFECKAGSISVCQCFEVKLTSAKLQHIGERYSDCLCVNCLRKIQQGAILHSKSDEKR